MKRMRYVIGGALVIGIAAGVWLGDLFKGLGTGNGVGIGQSGVTGTSSDDATGAADIGVSAETAAGDVPETLRVLIKDRSYFLRSGGMDTPIDLEALVPMVQSATGDDDGIKLKVYRAGSARASAELNLQEALKAAEVPESAVYTSPDEAE